MNESTRINSFLRNESGFALSASTLIFFMIMSIFAYYLARFTVTSRKTSANFIQNSRTLNLSQTGLEVGLTEIKEGRYGNLNGLNGNLNNGSFTISIDENNDEDVSLDKVSESENKEQEVNSDETDSSNS